MNELDIVPTRSLTQVWIYMPKIRTTDEVVFWNMALAVLRWIAPVMRYRAAWEYASARPTRKHRAERGPRHAAHTPFLAQLGIMQWLGELEVQAVDAAAKTA